jgi:hypothetical protein
LENFWQLLLSGADNKTPAIGRVLAALLFVNFLTAVPATIVTVLLLQNVKWDVWTALLTSLTLYVPSMVASMVAVVRVTNPTEPRPDGRPDDRG